MHDAETLLFYWVSGMEGPAGALDRGLVRPATDVVESADVLLVTVELAGIDRDTLSVVLTGRRLEVRGTRRPPEHATGGPKRYLRREIVYAPFERVLTLPEDIDEESFEAEYRDGMLTIRVRRRPAAPEPARRVEIR